MSNEKNLSASPIADKDLAEVAGGGETIYVASKNKYYRYSPNYRNMYEKYLCPNCHRPLHVGWWGRFYCDPCNASWSDVRLMIPNVDTGPWKEITKEEYDMDHFTFGPVM